MSFELPFILRKRSKEDPSLNVNLIQMSVYGTVVPDITVPEADVRYAGQNLHLSTYARPSNPAVSINFMVDNYYNNYYIFWKWLDVMNRALENTYGGTSQTQRSINDNITIGDQFEYQTTISIQALNEYNEPTIEFNYTKAFISKLGGITYSYRDGALIESTADFHFSQMSIIRKAGNKNITAAS